MNHGCSRGDSQSIRRQRALVGVPCGILQVQTSESIFFEETLLKRTRRRCSAAVLLDNLGSSLKMLNRKILIVYGSILVDPLIVQSYFPLVSTLKTSFNVNVELIALSLTYHMLPLAVLSLFSGTLSDFSHRPRILMYGLYISSIGSLLGAFSPNILTFMISRSVQGVGSALIMPISLALIGDIAPREAIGKAVGLSAVFSSFFGITLGPLISGFLASVEWRLVPLLFCAYTLVIGTLGRTVLRNLAASPRKGTMSVVLRQFSRAAMDKSILMVGVVSFLSMFSFQGMQPLISDAFSLSPLLMKKSEIGIIFSAAGFAGMFFSFGGGVLADRIGFRKNMVLGYLGMLLPMFLLGIADSYWSCLVLLSALSGFSQLANTSRSALVVELKPEEKGTTSSISNFAGFLGFASSPVALTQVYLTSGMGYVYLASFCCCCALCALP